MGIGTIVKMALKHVSWGQVADLAFQYGPDLVRRLKGSQQPMEDEVSTAADAEAVTARFEEVETALLHQSEVIKKHTERLVHLEEVCRTLQARLTVAITVSIAALVLVLVVAFLK